jgi:flagellar protein FliT
MINQQLTELLRVSTKLFELLSSDFNLDNRDNLIEAINTSLDERGQIVLQLKSAGVELKRGDTLHNTLIELDKGIKERLNNFMQLLKNDMKDLQNSKKNEQQYMNPYSNVRVMDGMYYDKKK